MRLPFWVLLLHVSVLLALRALSCLVLRKATWATWFLQEATGLPAFLGDEAALLLYPFLCLMYSLWLRAK